ncbi:MAG: hypothetical protein WBM13_11010 [Bacteroidia bacterium]
MKKTITIALLLNTYILIACDVCGSFMGITPYDNQSSITLMYRYKSFNGYGNSGQSNHLFPHHLKTTPTESTSILNKLNNSSTLRHGSTHTTNNTTPLTQRDYEIYTTLEMRAKYFIHKRIELIAIVPLIINSSRINKNTQQIKGIGDITAFAAYHLVSKIMAENFQHRLIIGAGLKLPVGNYYAKDENEKRYDFLIQPGTGSIDYMGYANYILGYKKLGLSINSSYKINGTNYYNERIANSTTNYLNLFYKFRQDKNLKLIPSIQLYHEYTKGLFINNTYQAETTMNVATGGVGLDIFYNNISINSSFQLPVYEKKSSFNLEMCGRFMIGLTYNFNQKKYLMGSKSKQK